LKKTKKLTYERLDFTIIPPALFYIVFFLLLPLISRSYDIKAFYSPAWQPYFLPLYVIVIFLSFKKIIVEIPEGGEAICEKYGPFITFLEALYPVKEAVVTVTVKKVMDMFSIKSLYILNMKTAGDEKVVITARHNLRDVQKIAGKIKKTLTVRVNIPSDKKEILSPDKLPVDYSISARFFLFFNKNALSGKEKELLFKPEGWNTGALIFGPFWCIAYRLYYEAIVAFLLDIFSFFLLLPVMHIAIGWQANSFAWRKGIYTDTEQFKEDQKKWFIASLFMVIAYIYFYLYLINWVLLS